MATGTTILEGALRSLGVLRAGGSSSTDQKTIGLEAINLILGSLSNDGLIKPFRTTESFSTAGSIADRTIGASGDWNTSKPTDIEAMWVRETSGVDNPVEKMTATEYAMAEGKSLASGRPTRFYFEPVDSGTPATLSKVYFNKTTSATETFWMISYKVFAQLSTIGDTVALDPAWIRLLKFNVAVDLAPELGVQVTPELATLAQSSMNSVRLLMADQVELEDAQG